MRTLVLVAALGIAACGNNSSEGAGSGGSLGSSGTTSTVSSSASTTGASSSSGVKSSTSGSAATGSIAASASSGTTHSSTTAGAASSTGAAAINTIPDPDVASLPVVSNPSNNPVLNPMSVVTVTFDGYAYTSQVEALGDYLATSNYLGNTIGEYGVGKLTNTNVETGQSAPATADDFSIQSWIESNYQPAGQLPPPDAGFTPIYVLYYPSTTKVTNTLGATSCGVFLGYHEFDYSDLLSASPHYTYAVVDDCGYGVGQIENTSVHEIAEAATDPNDADEQAWEIHQLTSPSVELGYNEIADLCSGLSLNVDAGGTTFNLPLLWSENAALDGGTPCLPVLPEQPYATVLVDQSTQYAAAGGTATFTLAGWSAAPTSAWQLEVVPEPGNVNGFTPTLVGIGTQQMTNGQSTTLTLGVPTGTSAGAAGGAIILSEPANGGGVYAITIVLLVVS